MGKPLKIYVEVIAVFIVMCLCRHLHAGGVAGDREWSAHSPDTICRTKEDRATHEQFVDKKIFLGAFRRAATFCISEKDAICWVLNDLSRNINVVDIRQRRIAGALGRLDGPLAVHYLEQSEQIIVVDEAKRPRRGVTIKFLHPSTGEQTKEIEIDDWRTYRINSAVLSQDESTLWLVTSATMSSLYGSVPSVMYQIGLIREKVEICVGSKKAEIGKVNHDMLQMRCVLDPQGRLFVSGHQPKTISQYDIPSGKLRPLVTLPDEIGILFADSVKARVYASLMRGGIAVIDTDKGELVFVIPTRQAVTAMCTVPETNELLIALKGSHELELVDTNAFDKRGIVILPGGDKGGPVGVAKMSFHAESGTLVAIVREGYGLALYDFQTNSGCFLDVRDPTCVRVDPRGKYAYTCNSGSGNISIVDLSADRFVGTIQIGGSPWDMDFLPGSKCALITDPARKRILTLDLDTHEILNEFSLEKSPYRVISSKDGKSCIVSWDSFLGDRSILDLGSGRITKAEISDLSAEAWPDIRIYIRSVAIGDKTGVRVKVPGWLGVEWSIVIGRDTGREYVRLFADNITSVALSADEQWAYIACQKSASNPVLLKVRIAEK